MGKDHVVPLGVGTQPTAVCRWHPRLRVPPSGEALRWVGERRCRGVFVLAPLWLASPVRVLAVGAVVVLGWLQVLQGALGAR